jgi:hypothetical protein
MRPVRHVPLIEKSFVGLATRRADRRVMLLANTSSIRFVAFLALGPSGGQRKPGISVNRPYGRSPLFLLFPSLMAAVHRGCDVDTAGCAGESSIDGGRTSVGTP